MMKMKINFMKNIKIVVVAKDMYINAMEILVNPLDNVIVKCRMNAKTKIKK